MTIQKIKHKVRKTDMIYELSSKAQYAGAGHFISSGPWLHPKRVINSYEIIFVLKGAVAICEDSASYILHENELLLLEPGKCHYGLYETENVEFYWLHFVADGKPPFKHFTPREPYEIKSQLKRMLHIIYSPVYPASSRQAGLTLLLDEICCQCDQHLSDAGNALSTRILEYIRLHAKEALTVEQIARVFGYSPTYISKFFRAATQMGLKDYIASVRMTQAKNLLISTDIPVKAVAYALGYEDEKNFIKFFTYHEQISPAKYRNLHFHTYINNK